MADEKTNNTQEQETAQNAGQQFDFDYEKLASIVTGKQHAAEDNVLKGYFKQMGLSAEEMAQAISSFKDQKAKNTPDVGALQSQVSIANQRALQAEIQAEAMLLASELGVDIKTMPYVIRMAELTDVVEDGKVNNEKLKSALTKVTEDVPQLKMSAVQGGFQKIGADTSGNNATGSDQSELYKAFGLKKKD